MKADSCQDTAAQTKENLILHEDERQRPVKRISAGREWGAFQAVTSPWPKAGRQKGQQAIRHEACRGRSRDRAWWGMAGVLKSERWAWAGLP